MVKSEKSTAKSLKFVKKRKQRSWSYHPVLAFSVPTSINFIYKLLNMHNSQIVLVYVFNCLTCTWCVPFEFLLTSWGYSVKKKVPWQILYGTAVSLSLMQHVCLYYRSMYYVSSYANIVLSRMGHNICLKIEELVFLGKF